MLLNILHSHRELLFCIHSAEPSSGRHLRGRTCNTVGSRIRVKVDVCPSYPVSVAMPDHPYPQTSGLSGLQSRSRPIVPHHHYDLCGSDTTYNSIARSEVPSLLHFPYCLAASM